MKIAAISDTHNYDLNEILKGKKAEVLVIAGDITGRGGFDELNAFEEQLQIIRDQFEHILWIGGNHDYGLYEYPGLALEIADRTKTTYLQRNLVTIKGVRFWGEASVPGLPNMAFPYSGSPSLFRTAPQTDVLVTHGPPKDILDVVPRYGKEDEMVSYGCPVLRYDLFNHIKPKVHIFGHIHHSHGFMNLQGVRFYNVAICTEGYVPDNPVTEINI